MRLLIFLLTLILFSAVISASCEEGQIDINSASLEELDQLYGIGPVKAQAIIDTRPFNSVDELINVNGIGEVTLNNIKSQGLACVDDEKTETMEEESSEGADVNNETELNNGVASAEPIKNLSSPIETELKAIDLNPKAIKSNEDSAVTEKRDHVIYGLLAFGVLLGLLFLIKNILKGNRYKNEFA